MVERSSLGQLLRYPGFVRLWLADGLSTFGTFIFGLSLQLLMIHILRADQLEIGWVRSAQWLPSLLFGLVAGVIVDRVRRRNLLIATDIASCIVLLAIAGLGIFGALSPLGLTVLVFLLGTAAVLQGGAHQSFTADLLPSRLLAAGSVVMTQTYTAAQTLGPLLAGVLAGVVGAPVTMLINAFTYAASAILLAGVPDPQQLEPRAPASVGADLREGIAWVYRHPYLAPYALCLHVWFIANAIAGTVYIFHATSLGLDGAAVGLTLGVAGLAGVLGAGLAERAAGLVGTGKAILFCDYLTGAGWLLVALAPHSDLTLYALIAAQIFYGIGFGLRGPLEMSFRNAVTPSRLRGRMNTTIRSINWGLIAVAAPFGGWLALQFGDRTALAIAGTMMLGTGTVLLLSRFRSASMPTDASA
ncbi:MFS transporter [Devosia sp.]|uniref:MFS transporter n=1 Tax=Devosia sp. TaxID=1871048 RepID=UPI003F70A3EB